MFRQLDAKGLKPLLLSCHNGGRSLCSRVCANSPEMPVEDNGEGQRDKRDGCRYLSLESWVYCKIIAQRPRNAAALRYRIT